MLRDADQHEPFLDLQFSERKKGLVIMGSRATRFYGRPGNVTILDGWEGIRAAVTSLINSWSRAVDAEKGILHNSELGWPRTTSNRGALKVRGQDFLNQMMLASCDRAEAETSLSKLHSELHEKTDLLVRVQEDDLGVPWQLLAFDPEEMPR